MYCIGVCSNQLIAGAESYHTQEAAHVVHKHLETQIKKGKLTLANKEPARMNPPTHTQLHQPVEVKSPSGSCHIIKAEMLPAELWLNSVTLKHLEAHRHLGRHVFSESRRSTQHPALLTPPLQPSSFLFASGAHLALQAAFRAA